MANDPDNLARIHALFSGAGLLPNGSAPPAKQTPDRRSWPCLATGGYLGPLAEFALRVTARNVYTETPPEAVYLSGLAGFSALVGPKARTFEAVNSPLRLNVLLVSEPGLGKGTSFSLVSELFGEELAEITKGGFGSGEALVDHFASHDVRCESDDPGAFLRPGSKAVWLRTVVPDERMLWHEDEMTRAFKTASKDGNTLLDTVRSAWSRDRLERRSIAAKDAGASPMVDAHISALGHITPDELRRAYSGRALSAGTASRFIFAALRPQGSVPLPVRPPFLRAFGDAVRDAIGAVRSGHLPIAPSARAYWIDELAGRFPRYVEADTDELTKHLRARQQEYIWRLGANLAVSMRSSIEVCHLDAGAAIVDYSMASAQWYMGTDAPETTPTSWGEQNVAMDRRSDKIIALLIETPGMTTRELGQRFKGTSRRGLAQALKEMELLRMISAVETLNEHGLASRCWRVQR